MIDGISKITKTGTNEEVWSVIIPVDTSGRLARECPVEDCSPGYFKIKPTESLTKNSHSLFCPYCRHASKESDFFSSEQERFMKDLAGAEMTQRIQDMLSSVFSRHQRSSSGSVTLSYKSGPTPTVQRPIEDEVIRNVICPYCGCDQAAFGIATWCAECGKDIFLSYIESEINTLHKILKDVPRRQQLLGSRISTKDIENCLEDCVSLFEGVLRFEVKHRLSLQGKNKNELETYSNKIGNSFQNIQKSEEIYASDFNISIFNSISSAEREAISSAFQKRHPITHNLGVIDKKYIEHIRAFESEGRDIKVTSDEINNLLEALIRVFRAIHFIEDEAPGAAGRPAEK